jgi:hypothetical protein
MAIDLVIAKFSQNSILDFVNEILKNIQNSNNFHIEKKLNFINIFNQFCYV